MMEVPGVYRAEPPRIDGDTLDAVELEPAAVAAWLKLARALAKQGTAAVIRPEEITDERAEPQADGSLLIFVDLAEPLGRVALTVPAGAWRWRPAVRQ